MSHYLLTFSKDWADEFEVYGFKTVTVEDSAKMNERYYSSEEPFEYEFGTNEGWDGDEDEAEVWDANVTKTRISEEEYNVLMKLFPDGEFGVFPFR